ncbi:putative YbeD-like domain superfamily protein [Dioscorea sansibarensis]
MSCRTVLGSVLLSEPWRRPLHRPFPFVFFPFPPASRSRFRPVGAPLRCSSGDASSPSPDDQGPPQEAVLKAISEVSKSEGRVAQTTNVVIGGTVTDDATDEWLVLDQKVNSYPMTRGFTAIGTGGDDFVQAMVVAVESVLQQPIPEGRVTQKLSSRGKYVSVNIGPIQVVSSEQVQAVYNAMRRDDRMKYFL